MSCLTELTLMSLADGALPADERSAAEAHVAACASCGERLAGLRAEQAAIAEALSSLPATPVPPFLKPASPRKIVAGAVSLVLVATFLAATPNLLDVSLPAPLTWFEAFDAVRLADLAVRVGLYLVERGDLIMTGILELAALASAALLIVWLVLAVRRPRRGPLLLVLLGGVYLLLPAASHAIEIRRVEHGTVLVRADETVEDTLLAFGEVVEVHGTVSGDLITAARRIVIHGRVDGQLVAAAEEVTIDGEVTGSLVGFARVLKVAANRIGGNFYGFAASIEDVRGTTVQRDAFLFAERAKLNGRVASDVLAFTEQLELAGEIGGSLNAYANRITLLAPARVTGNVVAHIPKADHLTVSPEATVNGEVNTEIHTHQHEEESGYSSFGYYMWQIVRFAAAFLVGLALFALIPGLRRASLDSTGEVFAAGAVGLVTLVAVPIVAVIVAITIVGIPIAVLAVLTWLVAIYLAKIVLAHFLGAHLLQAAENPRSYAVALVVGLLLVMIAVNLPFIGGLVNFLLTICGLGLLVLFGWQAIRARRQWDPAGA